jgi:hypothetical protein
MDHFPEWFDWKLVELIISEYEADGFLQILRGQWFMTQAIARV